MSKLRVILTAKDGAQPMQSAEKLLKSTESASVSVRVDRKRKYQKILGFGGAFTEAAADTYFKLSEEKQSEFIRAYFHPTEGNGYTFGRTHINSCDFSLGNYAYCEVPNDTELQHFDLSRDEKQLIPFIKRARAQAEKLDLLSSPWSPPAWMKTNGEMNNGGQLLPEYRETWAKYFVRYIREYESRGIPVWGVTVQNEPAAVQTWDSCIYSGAEEAAFVRDYLGPAFEAAGLQQKIIIWDHNRDLMLERAAAVLDDPAAAHYVWGTGFHWYGDDCFDNVQRVHDHYPYKGLIFTEGCQEGGTHLGSWALGERYATSVINDLNRHTSAWLDWNLLLDEQGGPNHVGNYCSAPILSIDGELSYQNSYYYLGHFSRFMRQGSRRIFSECEGEIMALAAENPDGKIAITVMNKAESAEIAQIKLDDFCKPFQLPARSIASFIFE